MTRQLMFEVEIETAHLAALVRSVTHADAKCLSWPFDSPSSSLRRIAKLTSALGPSFCSLSRNLVAFYAYSSTALRIATVQHRFSCRCPLIRYAF